jgi:hypothetical protein
VFGRDGYLDRVVKIDDAARDEYPDTIGIDDLVGVARRRRETRTNRAAGHAQLNANFLRVGSRELERPLDQIDGLVRQRDQETVASRL